jgi:hypothetical protein
MAIITCSGRFPDLENFFPAVLPVDSTSLTSLFLM